MEALAVTLCDGDDDALCDGDKEPVAVVVPVAVTETLWETLLEILAVFEGVNDVDADPVMEVV